MNKIEVKIGSRDDFESLKKLDYTNIYDRMFDISYTNDQISISEITLPEPIVNRSEIYTEKTYKNLINSMLENMSPTLIDKNVIPLVVFFNNNPGGCLIAKWEAWPNGKVLVIEGILVASQYIGNGLAKALVQKAIEIAKREPEGRGIHAEMDTTKYAASKLLTKIGFKFAGAKFFVYSKEEPCKYSKEAIYFYYPL